MKRLSNHRFRGRAASGAPLKRDVRRLGRPSLLTPDQETRIKPYLPRQLQARVCDHEFQ